MVSRREIHEHHGLQYWTQCPLTYYLNKGWNDPTPMIAPISFGMNWSSSQLLDLLHALKLGQFLFFFHLLQGYPLKKSIGLPKHFKPQLSTSTPLKTLNLAATQEQKRCYRRWCYKSDVEVLLQKTMLQRRCWSNATKVVLKQRCWKRCWNGVVDNLPPKDN